jgi:hypothetical protein
MNNPIRFAGLDLHTDEQSAPNSALALCAGVECEGGTLKPSFLAYTDLNFKSVVNSLGESVPPVLVYIHESSSYKHFICRYDDDNCVMYGFYYSVNDTYEWKPIPTISNQKSDKVNITSIGNTLVFNINGNVHYILFKRDEENYEYKYLGQKPPFVELQFGTSARIVHNDLDDDLTADLTTTEYGTTSPKNFMFRHDKTISKATELLKTDPNNSDWYTLDIKEEMQSDFTEAVKAFVNKSNSELAKRGCFYAPFMVRYAYRLYDGDSLMMHSAPVLIPVSYPNDSVFSLSIYNFYHVTDDAFDYYHKVVACNSVGFNLTDGNMEVEYEDGLCMLYQPGNVRLTYKCIDNSAYKTLTNDWQDIIKSIDIFITAPLIEWDQSALIKRIFYCPQGRATSCLINGDYTSILQTINKMPYAWLKKGSGAYARPNYSEYAVDLPRRTDIDFKELIQNTSTFFLLHSLSLEENSSLPASFERVPYRNGVLSAITTQKQMIDDYRSHNVLAAGSMFTYNLRLHLGDVKEKLFPGFGHLLLPDWNTVDKNNSIENPPGVDYTSQNILEVETLRYLLTTEDGVKCLQQRPQTTIKFCKVMPTYIFYPDTRATGVTLRLTSGKYLNIPLAECPGLNGAAWYGMLFNIAEEDKPKYNAPLADIVHMPNKLYISPIDNPFSFEPSDIMTVGTGRILGMAVSTRAISQGQYGTFPLTVFCSDGIWTFSVNSEGKYLQPSYLSSAITNNPAMLTQLDQSVIFPTKQAVNMLYGGDIRQISAPVNGLTFNTKDYTKLIDYLVKVSSDYDPNGDFSHPWHIMMYQDCRNPVEDITSSRCIYDAVNERLIFTKMVTEQYDQRELTMAYVYSLATDSWSTLPMPQVTNVVNAAPHPYLTLADGTTVCLDQRMDADSSSTPRYGVIVTRALKFEGVHKCIQAFDHSHSMVKPPVMFIFGSNNLRQWYYVCRTNQQRSAYMPGTTWRYFRMCLLLDMTAAERFYVTHLDIVEKYRKL